MASHAIPTTYGTANPTTLTDGTTYIIQNKDSHWPISFLDEPATYTTVQASDGLVLAPVSSRTGVPNWLKFTYDSARVVRIRNLGPAGTMVQVEIIESA